MRADHACVWCGPLVADCPVCGGTRKTVRIDTLDEYLESLDAWENLTWAQTTDDGVLTVEQDRLITARLILIERAWDTAPEHVRQIVETMCDND